VKYTIKWIENKTSAKGAPYAKATLVDEKGVETQDVTIFGSYAGFSDMRPETSTEGQLKPSVYNGKTSYVLERMVVAPEWATKKGGGAGIKAAQERKEVMIEKAQERKSESIAYFNAINSAIALYAVMNERGDAKASQEFIVEWRDWFLSEWEKYNQKPPF